MNKVDISIIVPIYNCENYIKECLDSLINQDYDKYEIILVNDGSTDNSRNICQEYEKKCLKIKIFNKENGGVSDARNYGINKAVGKYLFFVDSDDIIQTNTLSCMMDMLNKTNSDIAVGSFENFKDSYMTYAYDSAQNVVFSSEEFFYNILKFKNHTFACGTLIPKKYFTNLKFPKGRYFEDMAIMYHIYDKVSKIVINPANFYKYRDNITSIVHTKSEKKAKDYLASASEMIAFLKQNYNFPEDVINTYLCDVYMTAYMYYKDEDLLKEIKRIRKDINLEDLSRNKKIKLFLIKHSLSLTKLIMRMK